MRAASGFYRINDLGMHTSYCVPNIGIVSALHYVQSFIGRE